ncbi:uncharacterized protein N7496_010309 [Penicillium cataractarum]|uniref:Apple domain-containing protein n=1 Tax=Penicillium cataractarum TaxID=2100454 RepID=A0A9W9RR18_9EURO|nr:uncharacterized protein N7496_010309 [Penicillium cataractarum]KAJ5364596.1 hypothetical protein N7496_010309 [Penicillium cataractarum]
MRIACPLFASLLALGAVSNPVRIREDSGSGLRLICPGLNTQDRGCIRYTRGFDVTGVVTEVDLTFPQVRTECDCIQECLNRRDTCANYVWKFSTPESVNSGHRTCTLYSDFNLPAGVTLQFDLASPNNTNINAEAIIANGNNPHAGGLVPQAFKDANLDTDPDFDAVSGPVWTLANGQVQC